MPTGQYDQAPVVTRTPARGIIGVRTCLDPRSVIQGLRAMFEKDPLLLQHTCKWVPVDLWTDSELDSMKAAVVHLRDRIKARETGRMTVEKRRYSRYHTIELITALAELIHEKVDLTRPDKILRVDILGAHAALSVLTPNEIFSVVSPRLITPSAGDRRARAESRGGGAGENSTPRFEGAGSL